MSKSVLRIKFSEKENSARIKTKANVYFWKPKHPSSLLNWTLETFFQDLSMMNDVKQKAFVSTFKE